MTEPRPSIGAAEGRGKTLFVDAFSGVAGDMLLAALLDLGVPEEAVLRPLHDLGLEKFDIVVERISRSGISANHLKVVPQTKSPQRNHREIQKIIAEARLPSAAKDMASQSFQILANAEARVHDIPPEDVHFHEVGALDSIVDIVGCCLGLAHLGAEVVSSALPLGTGFVHAQHGPLPVPTPATLLCLQGVPTVSFPADGPNTGELVTPTGACLIKAHASAYLAWPDLCVERLGYGAGTRDVPDRPNLLRLVLGRRAVQSSDEEATRWVVEANIDDMSGELAGNVISTLLEVGALDAWAVPVTGKKGRPAWIISALATAQDKQAVLHAIMQETTTLGVRLTPVQRVVRPRRIIHVETQYGPIEVKVADGDGLAPTVSPEFESCRSAAAVHQVPTKTVFLAAQASADRILASDTR